MTADLPPIQRLAAGGEITPSEGVSIAAFGGGDAVPTAEGKRGRETLVSLPLLPPPPGGGNPHAMPWRTSPAREGHSRLQRRAAVSAEDLPSSNGKAKETPALGRAYPILLTARCTACSARFAACCAECRSDGFSIALAATMLITAPATAPVATPDTNGDTCILLPPFFAFFSAALRAAPLLCPAAPAFFLRQR